MSVINTVGWKKESARINEGVKCDWGEGGRWSACCIPTKPTNSCSFLKAPLCPPTHINSLSLFPLYLSPLLHNFNPPPYPNLPFLSDRSSLTPLQLALVWCCAKVSPGDTAGSPKYISPYTTSFSVFIKAVNREMTIKYNTCINSLYGTSDIAPWQQHVILR